MKSVDVKSSTYIDSSKQINHKDPKFKIGDIVRISKYENLFAKIYVLNWSEEDFMTKKVKNTCRQHMLLVILTKRKKFWNNLQKRVSKKRIKKRLELQRK